MLFLSCEGCKTKGVFDFNAKDMLDKFGDLFEKEKPDFIKPGVEIVQIVCDLCDGRGYHRKVYQTTESLKRMSVLRMLDLVYMEYKDRVRTQRLMDMFQVVAFPDDELEMTPAAKELTEKKEKEESKDK